MPLCGRQIEFHGAYCRAGLKCRSLPSPAGLQEIPKGGCKEQALPLRDIPSPQAPNIPPQRGWGCCAARRDRQRQEAVPGEGLRDLCCKRRCRSEMNRGPFTNSHVQIDAVTHSRVSGHQLPRLRDQCNRVTLLHSLTITFTDALSQLRLKAHNATCNVYYL